MNHCHSMPIEKVKRKHAPQPSWQLEYVKCNLCGADSASPVFAEDAHGFGLRTVVCTVCGLVYFNPRPTAGEYRRLYHGLYQELFPSAWLSRAEADAAAMRRLGWYEHLLTPGLRLLEVGPGKGSFLEAVQESVAGAIVLGIEPSADAVKACHARALNVQHGYIEEITGTAAVDVIAAFHVLEHALDPSALLGDLWKRLVTGGHILIEVPNILGQWNGLGMIHVAHPYQFSCNTISALLRKTGFNVVQLVAIEEKGFESSLRVVGQKTELSDSEARSPAKKLDDPELIQEVFQSRLGIWQRELTRFRLKRAAIRLLGPGFTRALRDRFG